MTVGANPYAPSLERSDMTLDRRTALTLNPMSIEIYHAALLKRACRDASKHVPSVL